MASFQEEDPTLPLEFEGSMNVDNLGDVANVTLRSDRSDGSMSMITKQGSGRMSPVRARTMKEYDTQIAELKKENFSLKLRIYFLEERMQQKYGDSDDLYKANIELKVEVESLKKDLQDKQKLLKQASNALETISSQRDADVKQVREEAAKHGDAQLTNQIKQLQQKLEVTEQELTRNKQRLDESNRHLVELRDVNSHLNTAYKQLEATNSKLENQLDAALTDNAQKVTAADIEEKDELIRQLRSAIQTKDLIIEQQEAEKQEIEVELNASLKQNSEAGSCMHRSQENMDHVALEEMENMQHGLQSKEEMIAKLEDIIRESDNEKAEIRRRLQEIEKVNKTHEENALKRDKAIQGLAAALHKREKELGSVKEQLEQEQKRLSALQTTAHQANMVKFSSVAEQQEALAEKDEIISQLEADLKHAQRQAQRSQSKVERSEKEIVRMRQQLEKVDDLLGQQDNQMQEMRESLQAEKAKMKQRENKLESHFKMLLEDGQRQVEAQENLVQRLTQAVSDKDQQLQESMAALDSGSAALTHTLNEQLAAKDKELEKAVSDRFKLLEEKDHEILQLKSSLHQHDSDLEKVNLMLLTAEETIGSLQSQVQEKDSNLKKLALAIQEQHTSMEETEKAYHQAFADKESLLKKLQAFHDAKDNALEREIQTSPSKSDSLLKQLQERLNEKEQFQAEVMADRDRIASDAQQTANHLGDRLKEKDDIISQIHDEYQHEIHEIKSQFQQLQKDINKKDFELQNQETRTQWELNQQQEQLERLMKALKDKDHTIDKLVASAQQKDELFTQLRSSSPIIHESLSAAQLTALQTLKDEVAKLSNDLQNKDALLDRLKAEIERLNLRLHNTQNACHGKVADTSQNEFYQQGPENEDVDHLHDEIDRLRQEIDRPGMPQRGLTLPGKSAHHDEVQQEVQKLKQLLIAEKDIYQSLKQQPISESEQLVREKLRDVESLRTDLEQSINRNQQIQTYLELQGSSNHPQSKPDSDNDELQSLVDSLQTQLEESRRWNMSLQTRLNEQPRRHAGVGASYNGHGSLSGDMNETDPSFIHTSFMPSFLDLPGLESLSDEQNLSNMTKDELIEVVHQVKDALSTSQIADAEKQLQAQLQMLQKQHSTLTEHNRELEKELENIRKSRSSENDAVIRTLKSQLAEAHEKLYQQDEMIVNLKEALAINKSDIEQQKQPSEKDEIMIQTLKKQLAESTARVSEQDQLISHLKEIDRSEELLQLTKKDSKPVSTDDASTIHTELKHGTLSGQGKTFQEFEFAKKDLVSCDKAVQTSDSLSFNSSLSKISIHKKVDSQCSDENHHEDFQESRHSLMSNRDDGNGDCFLRMSFESTQSHKGEEAFKKNSLSTEQALSQNHMTEVDSNSYSKVEQNVSQRSIVKSSSASVSEAKMLSGQLEESQTVGRKLSDQVRGLHQEIEDKNSVIRKLKHHIMQLQKSFKKVSNMNSKQSQKILSTPEQIRKDEDENESLFPDNVSECSSLSSKDPLRSSQDAVDKLDGGWETNQQPEHGVQNEHSSRRQDSDGDNDEVFHSFYSTSVQNDIELHKISDQLKLMNQNLNETLRQEQELCEEVQFSKNTDHKNSASSDISETLKKYLLELKGLRQKLEKSLKDNDTLRAYVKEHLDSKSHQSVGSNHEDVAVLLEEISRLRTQLERTIDNNNLLRAQLEQQLDSDVEDRLNRYTKHDNRNSLGSTQSSQNSDFNGSLNSKPEEPVLDRLNLSGMSGDYDMRYSINDPQRPPTQRNERIGSDLRLLYAIGELDDFELLKKEVAESVSVLNEIQSQLSQRFQLLRTHSTSPTAESSIVKEMLNSIDGLGILLQEQKRLVALFWTSQLPARDAQGNFIDVKMMQESSYLKVELSKWQKKYDRVKADLMLANKKLSDNNRRKEGYEREILRQLMQHHRVLQHTAQNLTNSHGVA